MENNLINDVRSLFVKAGYEIELNDPLLHTIVTILLSSDSSVRQLNDDHDEYKKLNAELKKSINDLKLETEKVKGFRCANNGRTSNGGDIHPYPFGTLLFGIFMGALGLGSVEVMIHGVGWLYH